MEPGLLSSGGALLSSGLRGGAAPDWPAETAAKVRDVKAARGLAHSPILQVPSATFPQPAALLVLSPTIPGSWGPGCLSAGRSCVLRVRPAATSSDSQHQLIIAMAAVKEAHFSSDRLMTCRTRRDSVTATSSGGSGCLTAAPRTHSGQIV